MQAPVLDLARLGPRERILETAARLFYRDGLRAVGIDRIIAESGTAKASFYRYFASKDALVEAFLALRHARWSAWFCGRLDALVAARGPQPALVAEVLGEWFAQPDFRGCAFINASAEGGLTPAGQSLVQRHKAELQQALEPLWIRAGAAAPAQAAADALLLVEGAIVRAQMGAEPAEVLGSLRRLLARVG